MRQGLQYAYSIGVFLGVLFASYFMMNQEGGARLSLQVLSGNSTPRTEAAVVDPAVNQLLEFEGALADQYREPTADDKKAPPRDQSDF